MTPTPIRTVRRPRSKGLTQRRFVIPCRWLSPPTNGGRPRVWAFGKESLARAACTTVNSVDRAIADGHLDPKDVLSVALWIMLRREPKK